MEKWLKWAIEIQSLAQAGLTYTDNVYDIERYERLREIAAEIIEEKSENGRICAAVCPSNGQAAEERRKRDEPAGIWRTGHGDAGQFVPRRGKLSARGERQARRGGGGDCQGVGKAADPSG